MENFETIIQETILGMLEEQDEELIDLMMEYEMALGVDIEDRDEFINESIHNLKDNLGMLNEDIGEPKDKSALNEELDRMKKFM